MGMTAVDVTGIIVAIAFLLIVAAFAMLIIAVAIDVWRGW